ncbi:molecular chaperone, partial [Oleiphilus sp. HI0069]
LGKRQPAIFNWLSREAYVNFRALFICPSSSGIKGGSGMISGFDFGTSNCAIGIHDSNLNSVRLLELEQGKRFMPSTLYALDRELISESVGLSIATDELKSDYIDLRSNHLARAQHVRREQGFGSDERIVYVGHEAFEEYLQWPGEGYFVKSPKSFLGASGLRPEAVFLFEDIVTAMMQSIKARAEQTLGDTISHTVIGRPVNFQGLDAEQSNRQALEILQTSAKRAGFKDVEFLFEPIAAGLSFERSLDADKTVLVVDIGGGTSDCAMVRMGPSYRDKSDRSKDFLGHSGERVGGNDLDIQLAGKHLMPLLGMLSKTKSGLPVPTQLFWDAVSTNDVSAQTRFNELNTGLDIEQLLRDCVEPDLIKRFISMRNNQQQHQLVRSAEQCKIALSSADSVSSSLEFIEDGLSQDVKLEQFAEAIDRPLMKMLSLMEEAITQAQ